MYSFNQPVNNVSKLIEKIINILFMFVKKFCRKRKGRKLISNPQNKIKCCLGKNRFQFADGNYCMVNGAIECAQK